MRRKRNNVGHQDIAEDLRAMIRSGALPGGARLASTRQLARRWKVAAATAARAIDDLVREGLVETKPRSGTVVAGVSLAASGETSPTRPRSRKRATRHSELSRERVLTAALALADDEGLAGLSLRGLARTLRVPVMSLYRHVSSKDELVAGIVDAARVADSPSGTASTRRKLPKAGSAADGWRPQLEHAARHEWALMQKHPWIARVTTAPDSSENPGGASFAARVARALEGSPLRPGEKLELHVILHSFIQGLAVNSQAEAQAVADTGFSERTARRALGSSVLAQLPKDFELDTNRVFERGLKALLDGFTPLVHGQKPRR